MAEKGKTMMCSNALKSMLKSEIEAYSWFDEGFRLIIIVPLPELLEATEVGVPALNYM